MPMSMETSGGVRIMLIERSTTIPTGGSMLESRAILALALDKRREQLRHIWAKG